MTKRLHGLVAGTALVALGITPVAAQDVREITLVQAHAQIGVGEEVFLYAVPHHLGWFADEGIAVNIEGVRGGTLAAQVLQSGDAEVASTDPAVVMSVREKGGDIKIFYALRRQGGFAIAVPADSEIQTIEDLEGKIIGAASLASGAVPIVNGMMSDLGFSEGDYTIVAAGTGGQAASAIATQKVDALSLWDSVYAVIENQGIALRYLQIPAITQLAGFSLAATDDFIAEDPEVIEGLCRAVSKGVVFARENPEAAIRIFYEVFPEVRPADLDDARVKADSNILTKWLSNGTGSEEGVPLGWSYPEKWEFSYEYYQDNGRISEPEPLESHYTNDFIDTCNDFDAEEIREMARSM